MGRNEESTRQFRKECLVRLQFSIESWNHTFGTKPYLWAELVAYIQDRYFRLFIRARSSVDNLMEFLGRSIMPSFAGICQICTKKFEIPTVCKTECDHTFHFECIMKQLKEQQKCPICHTFVAKVFQKSGPTLYVSRSYVGFEV